MVGAETTRSWIIHGGEAFHLVQLGGLERVVEPLVEGAELRREEDAAGDAEDRRHVGLGVVLQGLLLHSWLVEIGEKMFRKM